MHLLEGPDLGLLRYKERKLESKGITSEFKPNP